MTKITIYLLWSDRISSAQCKWLDLLPYDLDTSIIGGVQFQYPILIHATKHLPRGRMNNAGFASTWWSIKQHIGKVSVFHGLPYHIHHLCLLYDVVDIPWSAVNIKKYEILILFLEVEKKSNDAIINLWLLLKVEGQSKNAALNRNK